MGRAEIGSAKHQSKQLKASGLQKLRFYCQLCQKQCRDANGFKNHINSPSHTGRISNLSKDGKTKSVIEQYSKQFEADFLRLLRISHGTKNINANKFYQEYILNDKNHVHMNATRWTTLTSFIKYLGQSGKVRVDLPADSDDEFNLVIRLVDGVSDLKGDDREKTLQTEEERSMRFLDAQVEAGKHFQENFDNRESSSSPRTPVINTGPVSISLKGPLSKKRALKKAFGNDSDEE